MTEQQVNLREEVLLLLIDIDRKKVPISATKIRENCEQYKCYLEEFIFDEIK